MAVVVPRFGPQIGGGIEALARMYALRLAARTPVTVLTTCAVDYRTWRDELPAGVERDGDVEVKRFRVPHPRDTAVFDAHSATVLPDGTRPSRADQERWMDLQGPNSPDLLEHLSARGDRYDVVLFMPYLYATTVRGLPLVTRSVVQPALHDEPMMRLAIYDDALAHARGFVFNTPEERTRFAARFGRGGDAPIVGAGIDPPPASDPGRARAALGIERDYVLYVGRLDASKGVDALIECHAHMRGEMADPPDLVLAGPPAMDVAPQPWLHVTGFVDEQTKHDLVEGALALATASPYESLSIVLLEAWAHGTPTMCAAGTDVLTGQTTRSGGGLWFADKHQYLECVDTLVNYPPLRWSMGFQGRRYTRGLAWDAVIDRLCEALAAAR